MNTDTFLMHSPQITSLTDNDLKRLQRNKAWIFSVWISSIALFVSVFVSNNLNILEQIAAINTTEDLLWLGLARILGVALILGTIAIGIILLKQLNNDRKKGIKHVGLAKVISKYITTDDGDSTYSVECGWYSSKNQDETMTFNNSKMYDELKEGDRIYLELAPQSAFVFEFRKK